MWYIFILWYGCGTTSQENSSAIKNGSYENLEHGRLLAITDAAITGPPVPMPFTLKIGVPLTLTVGWSWDLL